MFQLISFVIIIFFFIFNSLIVRSSAFCATGKMWCGKDVRYPFWYQDKNSSNFFFSDNQDSSYSTKSCGYSGFEINCIDIDPSIDIEDQRALMNISNQLYYVLNIDYYNKKLTLLDVDVDEQDCPHPKRNISLESTPSLYGDRSVDLKWYLFYNCSIHPVDNDSYHNISCLDNYYNSTTVRLRSYYYFGYFPGSRMPRNCEETVVIPSASVPYSDSSDYTKSAKFGFELTWSAPIGCEKCERTGGNCYYNNTKGVYLCDCNIASSVDGSFCPHGMPTGLKVIIGASTGVGGLLLSLLLLYRKTFYTLYHSAISSWKKKIIKKPSKVEEFLESYGVALHRYSYSEIKKMTNSFKDTLGQGGYGSVFQGKLNRDGLLVAVKVLNEAKGNGEDFINEVATIGRTNHVNVVSLLGFCTEGTKRALVYEFMPNGSLEKFIYNDKTSSPNTTTLGWDKLYQIALGIARGLEYLHCRCNTRIVHFDIKPHNILLDQAFCPKISDFGLAKLCPTKESIVSMVGARGTMGYIAPEISCRNLGDVSHKSDVYSYGMMVLEMIGGRKNLDVTVENISGIYFPHWIYNQLKRNSEVEGPEVMKLEGAGEILKNTTAKKMIITALWCIQTHPANRPSMTKVVEMLEGSNEELQMPPNPSLDPLSLPSSSPS